MNFDIRLSTKTTTDLKHCRRTYETILKDITAPGL